MAYSSALSHQSSSWRDNLLSIDRGKAVDELLRGRDVANQLRELLGKRKFPSAAGDPQAAVPAEDLVTQILKSFGATLSMLNSSAPSESESDEVSQIPVGHVSEDSGGDSCCKSTETLRERRACYKKRKSDNTYTKVTSDLIDDGYAWRKYGQKGILHTEFPRNYFRCTHKYDKPGCQASKQVQQISKDPPRFRTTYMNHHTCKNYLQPPQIVFDPTHTDSSTMLCFQTSTVVTRQDPCNNNDNNNNNSLFSSTCFASTSHDSAEEIRSDNTNNNNNQSSSSDYQYMTSLPDFGDQQNTNSCTTTNTSTSHGFEFEDVCDLKFVVDEGGYYNYSYC